jgi:2-polyprenyl-3-methyl-5-hydroxy-6-metoxy-1,4-benzoquinol methylase
MAAECSIPCNLCGSDEVEEIGSLDRDGNALRSVICVRCGLSWSDPRPNENEIRRYYSKDYRIKYKGTYRPLPKHVYRALGVARYRRAFLEPFLEPGAKLLDVGSGGGEFVFLMRKLGFDAEGIEPNEGYGNYAKAELGLPIRIGFVQQFELPDAAYDAITLHHVLEHLDDPFGALQKLRRALKPGGHLMIEVPNIEGICYSPKSRFHAAHLYNFNNANLELMARKAGFETKRLENSSDGGVITTVFGKSEESDTVSGAIDGNFRRVAGIVRGHRPLGHFLTAAPYLRPLSKARRSITEKRATRRFDDVRRMLEELTAK